MTTRRDIIWQTRNTTGRLIIPFFLISVFMTSCQAPKDSISLAKLPFAYKSRFHSPPSKIPVPYSTDAPMLGNGYTGVAISGPPEKQVYYFARNDFWRLKSSYNESFPAVLGKLEIILPDFENAQYLIEQDLREAKTYSRFSKNEQEILLKSYISAVEDLLIIEVINAGDKIIEGSINLELPGEKELKNNPPMDVIFPTVTSKGRAPEGTSYITRAFEEDVEIPTMAAVGASILSQTSEVFTLNSGKSAIITVSFSSNFKSDNCLQTVLDRLSKIRKKDLKAIEDKHDSWWENFWSKSSIAINDSLIERQYHLSNYNLACFSRDRDFPPSIFGTCVTMERPAWNGDYHLNYNHLAPYYGLFSSNHIEQAIPCNIPLLAIQARGEYYSGKVCGITGGIMLPVGIGPLGIETTRRNEIMEIYRKGYIDDGNVEDEGLFFGQKSNSSYSMVNMASHFYTTYDEEYTKLYYPFIKGVATFWENYLTFENGRYVIYNDAIHEGTVGTMNPVLSLGLVPLVMQTAIDMSKELKIDINRHEKWQHIIDNLSDYTYQERDGKKVFRYTEKGTDWWGDNTLGIQHIYPGSQIGLNSDPELLQVSHNTIDVMQRWIDFNGSNSFFPAAVRVGYDPDIILDKLHEYTAHTYPNGFQLDNPHGIENLSTVPNTINEMLCMGHQGILRVFPVWPRDKDASFNNLRKEGAFLVSSELKNGEVLFIEILSEKGKTINLLNPWPDNELAILRNQGNIEQMRGKTVNIQTSYGERITIRKLNN